MTTSTPKKPTYSETRLNQLAMQSGPVYCAECDNVSKEYATAPEYLWLCLKHPRLDGHGFVSRTIRDGNLPPYLRCKDVNGGYCYLFKPKADGQTNLQLKQEE